MSLNGSDKTDKLEEVTVEKVIYGGSGLARSDGGTIFIPLSAPGERVLVRQTEEHRNYRRATIEEILEPSPARRQPPCRYYGVCGGCQLQHIDYAAQLKIKSEFIRESLYRIGRINWDKEIPIKHAAEFGYRSRAQLKIEPGPLGAKIGFYKASSHDICEIEECPLLLPQLNEGLAQLRALGNEPPLASEVEIVAGDNSISFAPAPAGLPADAVEQRIMGARYRFSAGVFFQINRLLVDELVQTVVEGEQGERAVELYAGVGLFTVQLARRFAQVFAVESSELASQFAVENLAENHIGNVSFFVESVEEWLVNKDRERLEQVDLLLLDPPRAGAAPELVEAINRWQPRRVVYVSCDPTTLARDLHRLVAGKYVLDSIVALDMFPQTYHVETVARLKLQKAEGSKQPACIEH